MPQPRSISPGKGREALRQKVQISRLKYGMAQPYILFASKFKVQISRLKYGMAQPYILFTSKIYKQKFSKILFPSKIPANYANSAQFAPTVREFRKICTFYIMFQVPAPAENFQKFQRIMQIPHSSPT